MAGPLQGIRILELAGIGPGPFCGMMLADMGAEVIRIDRPGGNPSAEGGHSVLFRNRRSIAVNLKQPRGVETILRLCETADAIFEGFRPGVTERLGVGPDACLARNPKLVYGRMTGWGQDGPLAHTAGHDMNYISLSGALHAIGRRNGPPVPPLNLVGDFGGGGMMLAFGMVCALLEAQKSGKGQVVDSSMVEGSAALMAMFYGMKTQGLYNGQRGSNLLDTGAHFYDVYETSDGKYISVGAIEPQFYAILREKAGLDDPDFNQQMNFPKWPQLTDKLAAVIKTKTRDEWAEIFEGTDACVAPVLDMDEAPKHPHNVARGSFIEVDGETQPAPTPRFSRSAFDAPSPIKRPGTHTRETLLDCGFSESDVDDLIKDGAVTQL